MTSSNSRDLQMKVGDWSIRVGVDLNSLPSHAREHFEALIAAMNPLPIVDYTIRNPDEKGAARFYEVRMGVQYKNPMVHEEPDGGWDCPPDLTYVDPYGELVSAPTTKIVGAVFHEDDGKLAKAEGKDLRFSFSNPEAPEIGVFSADGSIVVAGRTWHLIRVHSSNRGRMVGLVAFFRPTQAETVIVSELAHVGV